MNQPRVFFAMRLHHRGTLWSSPGRLQVTACEARVRVADRAGEEADHALFDRHTVGVHTFLRHIRREIADREGFVIRVMEFLH